MNQQIMKVNEELDNKAVEYFELKKQWEINTVDNYLDRGRVLKEIRDLCDKRKVNIDKWIKKNIDLSKSQFYKLIQVYEKSLTLSDDKVSCMRLLSFNKAYDVFIPKDSRTKLIKIQSPSETEKVEITSKELDGMKDKIQALTGDNQVLQRDLAKAEADVESPDLEIDPLEYKKLSQYKEYCKENVNRLCSNCSDEVKSWLAKI